MRPDLLLRDMAPRASTFDAEALTVEAVVATAAQVARRDAAGPFLEILDPAGADIAALAGAPVLDSHRQDGLARVLGTIDAARIEAGAIVVRVRFSRRPDVAPYVEDVRTGVIKHLSAGYTIEAAREGRDPASGKRTRTAIRWTPREVSFVAVPADPACIVRTEMPETETLTVETPPAMPPDRAAINRQIRELATRAGAATAVTDELIDRNASIEEARSAILDELLARSRTPIRSARHNDTSLDNPEVRVRAMGEALYLRVDPAFQPSEAARAFVGLTLPEIGREVLKRSGIVTHGFSADAVITRALHTTSDFSAIMGDTIGRTLRASYKAAPSGIRRLGRQTSVSDFRRKSRIMLDSTGVTLEKVNEHGEFKSGTFEEAAESYRIDTFGRIFGITRQAIVNDDLGAFTDISRRLGQAAAAFEAQFLVGLLEGAAGLGPVMGDGKALFHVDHGNLAGSGATLSVASLTAARLAMRRQTGIGGGLISVTPKFLVVPPELETAAEKLLTEIRATTTAEVNPFSNLVLVVEPRLSSATRWYLTADPAEIDGLEFAYLAGAPGPQTETRNGFEIDGVQVKVRLDFGGGFVDWRGWYANAGA